MTDEPTCGLGLAEHSALPAKLAELTAGVAETLEVHMRALDLRDPDARAEHDAYQKLVAAHRELAARLQATSEEMAGYRNLSMGRHDMAVMTSPDAADAFERYVEAERQLLALLQHSVERDQAMLLEMGRAGSGER
jgi:hypothetical protein